ncbi:mimitin, mitochondrial [Acrasis kona]|uniref:Mimitin, mitochondrial n=1 Tax=Acrasis kona TaxID=1008807 RepID=A0AAW2ZL49_9EUKA
MFKSGLRLLKRLKDNITKYNDEYNGTKKLVGVDKSGYHYYTAVDNQSNRVIRIVTDDKGNPLEHDQKLPLEWRGWMQYQRKDPPTIEEIEDNEQFLNKLRNNVERRKQQLEREEMQGRARSEHHQRTNYSSASTQSDEPPSFEYMIQKIKQNEKQAEKSSIKNDRSRGADINTNSETHKNKYLSDTPSEEEPVDEWTKFQNSKTKQ